MFQAINGWSTLKHSKYIDIYLFYTSSEHERLLQDKILSFNIDINKINTKFYFNFFNSSITINLKYATKKMLKKRIERFLERNKREFEEYKKECWED